MLLFFGAVTGLLGLFGLEGLVVPEVGLDEGFEVVGVLIGADDTFAGAVRAVLTGAAVAVLGFDLISVGCAGVDFLAAGAGTLVFTGATGVVVLGLAG